MNMAREQFYVAYRAIRTFNRRSTYYYKSKSRYAAMYLVLNFIDHYIVRNAFISITNRGIVNE